MVAVPSLLPRAAPEVPPSGLCNAIGPGSAAMAAFEIDLPSARKLHTTGCLPCISYERNFAHACHTGVKMS